MRISCGVRARASRVTTRPDRSFAGWVLTGPKKILHSNLVAVVSQMAALDHFRAGRPEVMRPCQGTLPQCRLRSDCRATGRSDGPDAGRFDMHRVPAAAAKLAEFNGQGRRRVPPAPESGGRRALLRSWRQSCRPVNSCNPERTCRGAVASPSRGSGASGVCMHERGTPRKPGGDQRLRPGEDAGRGACGSSACIPGDMIHSEIFALSGGEDVDEQSTEPGCARTGRRTRVVTSDIAARFSRRHHVPGNGGSNAFRNGGPGREEPARKTRTAVRA